jgi:hypothetical protein
MCSNVTKEQYLKTRGVKFDGNAVALAKAVFDGDHDSIPVLHDALLDAGLPAFAEHFAVGADKHEGLCWGLRLLLSCLPEGRIPIGTPLASEWLGLKPEQFRRLAKKLKLRRIGEYKNRHYKSGPKCPLWAADDVLSIDEAHIEAIKRRRRKAPRE